MIEATIVISSDKKKKQFYLSNTSLSEEGALMCLMCLAEYCKKQFNTPTNQLIAATQMGTDEKTISRLKINQ